MGLRLKNTVCKILLSQCAVKKSKNKVNKIADNFLTVQDKKIKA
jgi:hypothetical protein